jgi:quercetin dioxygenase-like cupin family protein
MRYLLLVPAILGLGVGPAQSQVNQAATAPGSTSTAISRTGQTISGQPLKLPPGPAEMVASAVEIAPNGVTTLHMHPWSRFVYVERGPLEVVNQDTGKTDKFQTGQLFPEVVTQWHQGHAGPAGAKLIVIDLVPPGATNMVMK